MKAQIPNPPVTQEDQAVLAQYQEMDKRYHELAAGFYSDALPASTTTVGFVPILIIAGLAAGVAGCAWAVAAYEYAVNLREQTALADKELTERVAASKEGRTLQATTLPTQPDPLADATGGMGKLLIGGLALGAAANGIAAGNKEGPKALYDSAINPHLPAIKAAMAAAITAAFAKTGKINVGVKAIGPGYAPFAAEGAVRGITVMASASISF